MTKILTKNNLKSVCDFSVFIHFYTYKKLYIFPGGLVTVL